jgi:hypothetical protein
VFWVPSTEFHRQNRIIHSVSFSPCARYAVNNYCVLVACWGLQSGVSRRELGVLLGRIVHFRTAYTPRVHPCRRSPDPSTDQIPPSPIARRIISDSVVSDIQCCKSTLVRRRCLFSRSGSASKWRSERTPLCRQHNSFLPAKSHLKHSHDSVLSLTARRRQVMRAWSHVRARRSNMRCGCPVQPDEFNSPTDQIPPSPAHRIILFNSSRPILSPSSPLGVNHPMKEYVIQDKNQR